MDGLTFKNEIKKFFDRKVLQLLFPFGSIPDSTTVTMFKHSVHYKVRH